MEGKVGLGQGVLSHQASCTENRHSGSFPPEFFPSHGLGELSWKLTVFLFSVTVTSCSHSAPEAPLSSGTSTLQVCFESEKLPKGPLLSQPSGDGMAWPGFLSLQLWQDPGKKPHPSLCLSGTQET